MLFGGVNVREKVSLAEVFDSVGQLALSVSVALFGSCVVLLNFLELFFSIFNILFLLHVLCFELIELFLSVCCFSLHSLCPVSLSLRVFLPQLFGQSLWRALQFGHGFILPILVKIVFITCILANVVKVLFLRHSSKHTLVLPLLHLLQLLLLDQLVLLKSLSLCLYFLLLKLLEVVLNDVIPLVFADVELLGRVLIH